MDKKAFFFDLDGTLLKPGAMDVCEQTQKLIYQLKLNHDVYLCTGRNYLEVADIAQLLKIPSVIVNDGHTIYREGTCVYKKPYEPKMLAQLLEYANKVDISVILHSDDAYYTNKMDPAYASSSFYSSRQDQLKLVTPLTLAQEDIYAFSIFVTAEEEPQHPFLKQFNMIRFHQDSYFSERFAKGEGIKRMIKIDQLDPNATIGFGDGENDFSMFNAVAYKVAMADGQEGLKALADEIAPSVHEHGIYQVCLKNKWIEEIL